VVQSIRVGTVLDVITGETEREIKKRLEEGEPAEEPETVDFAGPLGRQFVFESPRSGTVEWIDEEELVSWARKHEVVARLLVPVGVHVPEGSPLFSVYAHERPEKMPFDDLVLIGPGRTIEHDFAYGLRQLVDIALRALSPSLNDPGTAVRVIDRLHELLRMIGVRALPAPLLHDDDGVLRGIVPRITWEGYVLIALQEIMDVAGEHVEVVQRLMWLTTELEGAVVSHRRGVLRRVRAELESMPAAGRRHRDWAGLPEHRLGRPPSQ
jgi:uncharacterized membrane protein